MKRTIPTLLLTVFPAILFSQVTTADLDINHVRATILTHGDMFNNPNSQTSAYEFPKGSGKHCAYTAGLWVGGFEKNTNALKVAAQTYRQTGNDYWAGPIINNGTGIDSLTSLKWEKIWKINKTDVDAFLITSPHTISNTPQVILEWPAKGNPHCKDAFGNSLNVSEDMAPFIDMNGDGNYNALDGDYPLMKGDQMLWWIFNDACLHTETNSSALMIQVKASAFAFECHPSYRNVTFYSFEIENFNTSGYDSLVAGIMADVDLGYAFDDYIGFDSLRSLAYVYNGDAYDNGPDGYGYNLTKHGYKMLQGSGNHPPLGNFCFYNNVNGSTGNPGTLSEYYGYLNSTWKDGLPYTKSWNGRDQSMPVTTYMYSGDPCLAGSFSEKSFLNVPDDRRIILSTKPIDVAAGSQPLLFSFAILNTENDTTCSLLKLQTLSDSVSLLADNNFNYPCSGASTGVSESIESVPGFRVYPNPTSNTLNIEFITGNTNGKTTQFEIYNILGQSQSLPFERNLNSIKIETNTLADGLYYLIIEHQNKRVMTKFLKQN